MKYADIIIPHGRSNTIAIDFVISNLKAKIPITKIVTNRATISAQKDKAGERRING